MSSRVAVTGLGSLSALGPDVAAHLVNLGWNGLAHLEAKPKLITPKQ